LPHIHTRTHTSHLLASFATHATHANGREASLFVPSTFSIDSRQLASNVCVNSNNTHTHTPTQTCTHTLSHTCKVVSCDCNTILLCVCECVASCLLTEPKVLSFLSSACSFPRKSRRWRSEERKRETEMESNNN